MGKGPKAKAASGELTEEDAPIDSLLDNPRNPNEHPDEQIERLMASLRSRGQYRAILARRENRMLIAGHGLRRAAARLGWTHIKVALWDVDQATADRAMLADNRLADLSTPNSDRVSELPREIPEADWLGVGFSADEAEKMLADLSGSELKVHEIEVSDVNDTFWISVRGPLPRQADVLKELKDLLGRYLDVTVEMGTLLIP